MALPQEVKFETAQAICDGYHKNRYWFNLPDNWCDQLCNDSIIGIRDIYLSKMNRDVDMNIRVIVYDKLTQIKLEDVDVRVRFFMGREEQMFHLRRAIQGQIARSNISEPYKTGINPIYRYDTEWTEGQGDPAVCNWYFEDDVKDPSKTVEVSVTFNTDAGASMFNAEKGKVYNTNPYFKNIWDRDDLYITSSISNLTEDSFLGHTRSQAICPMKYYRLTGSERRFWIELYSTSFRRCGMTLPDDNLDSVIIEAVVIFNRRDIIA